MESQIAEQRWTENRRARVLLADENPQVRDQVTRLLAPEFQVVGAYSDGRSVLCDCKELKPDIVILDTSSLGEVSGIEVARELRASGHAAKIVFVAHQEDVDFVAAAIGSGGSAYVVKSRIETELPVALQSVRVRRLYVSEPVLAQIGRKP